MNPRCEPRSTLARWGVLIAALLTLTGCVRLDVDVALATDDTLNGRVTMAASQEAIEASDYTKETLLEGMDSTVGLGRLATSTKTYARDGYTGRVYTFEDTPISTFAAADAKQFKITREGDAYRVSGTWDLTVEGWDLNTSATSDAKLEELGKGLEITIAITFPGAVEEANGDIDGHTVTWHLEYGGTRTISAVGSAQDEPSPTASASTAGNDVADGDSKNDSEGIPMWVWFAAGGGLLLLIVVIVIVVAVRGRKKKAAAANRQYPAGVVAVPGQHGASVGQPYPQPAGYRQPQPHQQQPPHQLPAQLPSQLPAQPPYQLPAQPPYQLPAQLPSQLPSQLPAQPPYQLPAQLPTQPEAQPGYRPTSQPYPQPQDPTTQPYPQPQDPSQPYPGQQYPGQPGQNPPQ